MSETPETPAVIPSDRGGRTYDRSAREGGFTFGRFDFFPLRRVLIDGTSEQRLGGRAAAILTLLLERAGEVVSKDDIFNVVWGSTFVEEGNLRVQIAGLRKALGEFSGNPEFISSVVGQGYCFVGEVEIWEGQPSKLPSKVSRGHRSKNWPTSLGKLVGRELSVSELVDLMQAQRLVTVVGPGGIGKTTLAVAALARMPEPRDGVFFVDLAAISDVSLLPFAIATAFNISAETQDPFESLLSYMLNRRVLILLDNCEHLVDGVAELAEFLLRGAPGLRVLATSHEPLRVEGEWLYRLAPLELPTGGDLSLHEAMRYPAFELFVVRALSDDHSLSFDDTDVPFIVEICRKLDGIPLAIEIAAARVEMFGISELADRLEERLDVPNVGKRSVERHQTIRKLLDWSHETLSSQERVLLRRLSVFAGPFPLEAAAMVAGDESLSGFAITEAVSGLVRKSLLHPNSSSRPVTYRLLESTRIYASEKLAEAGEGERLRRLHTEFLLDTLERAEADWVTTRRQPWIERYANVLDDVRQAISWAFSPAGDAAAGVRLTALAMPLALQIGLIDEFRERNEIAMAHARDLTMPELVAEMRLNIFTAFLNTNQSQPQDHTMSGVARAVHLAELTNKDIYRLQPLFQLAGFKMGMGDYPAALRYAEELFDLSEIVGDEHAILGSKRMLAQTSHFNGLHTRTISLAKSVLASPVVNIPIAFGSVQVDRRVSMRIVMSRSLWLQGKPDEAAAVMREALEIAPEDGPHALCHALSQAACPLSFWRGDQDVVGRYVEQLLEVSARFTLKHWNSWGQMYSRILALGHSSSKSEIKIPTEGELQTHTLATIRGQLTNAVFKGDGVAEGGWAAPELLRRRALAFSSSERETTKTLLMRSLDIARSQGALAWELRTATSLTRVFADSREKVEGIDRLADVYAHFTEGFETTDLVDARIAMGV